MNLEYIARAMLCGIALYFVLFAFAVYYQRLRLRRSQRRGKRLRFYSTNMMIGLALQNLQVFVHPEVGHTMAEMYADATEEGEGNPDDPQKVLAHQLQRIRNGEVADLLQVPLPAAERDAQ